MMSRPLYSRSYSFFEIPMISQTGRSFLTLGVVSFVGFARKSSFGDPSPSSTCSYSGRTFRRSTFFPESYCFGLYSRFFDMAVWPPYILYLIRFDLKQATAQVPVRTETL